MEFSRARLHSPVRISNLNGFDGKIRDSPFVVALAGSACAFLRGNSSHRCVPRFSIHESSQILDTIDNTRQSEQGMFSDAMRSDVAIAETGVASANCRPFLVFA